MPNGPVTRLIPMFSPAIIQEGSMKLKLYQFSQVVWPVLTLAVSAGCAAAAAAAVIRQAKPSQPVICSSI